MKSIDELVAEVQRGNRIKYLFFWGHTASKDGSTTKACFSQWFHSPFTVDGISYPTAEHFMMAGKARLFGDHATEELILKARHPKEAKDLGRKVRGFEDDTWNRERYLLVVEGNEAKFSQNSGPGAFLLDTKDRVLVEASPVDRIWGIGLAADDPAAENPRLWKGLNLLGFALMEVRERLQPKVAAGNE